jgi:hypothetical protein
MHSSTTIGTAKSTGAGAPLPGGPRAHPATNHALIPRPALKSRLKRTDTANMRSAARSPKSCGFVQHPTQPCHLCLSKKKYSPAATTGHQGRSTCFVRGAWAAPGQGLGHPTTSTDRLASTSRHSLPPPTTSLLLPGLWHRRCPVGPAAAAAAAAAAWG